MGDEPTKQFRREPTTPEGLLKWGRLVATIGVIELILAAVLFCWHLERFTWLEMLRSGLVIGGTISLSVGLAQAWDGRRKSRRR